MAIQGKRRPRILENSENKKKQLSNVELNNEINSSVLINYPVHKKVNQIHTKINAIKVDKYKLKIWYTNADCLRNKFCELKSLLKISNEIPDVIAINEVKSKCNWNLNIAEYNLSSYNIYNNLNAEHSRGIIIYVNNKINTELVEFDTKFNEEIFIKIMYKFKGINNYLQLGCIYRSPNSTLQNDAEMIELLKLVYKNPKVSTVVIGDFNLPNINWTNCTASDLKSNKFLDVLMDNYIIQNVCKPTRVRNTDEPHILDLVLTNHDIIENILHTSPLGKSDHALLQIECNANMPENTKMNDKLNFNKGNYTALRESLKINWDKAFAKCDNDINKIWNVFTNIINEKTELYIPKTINFNKWKNPSWKRPISKEVNLLIKRKHRLWTRFIETKSVKSHLEFKKIRNKVKREMNKSLIKEQRDIAEGCKKNPKKFWNYIKSKNKPYVTYGELKYKDQNGQELYAVTAEEKSEALCNYFSNVFVREPLMIVPQDKKIDNLKQENTEMEDITITEEDILARLAKLKVNKSPGPDNLYPRVLQEIRAEIAYPLKLIFENSLRNNKLPTDWKSANVTPIYKKGDKKSVENYRPISLTCVASKILEAIIRDQILNHFIYNNYFTNRQYGFIKGRSTIIQLLTLMEDWTRSLEDGGQIDVIYTDIAKAFDKIPHNRLLYKLKKYHVKQEIIDWIDSFLKGRVQRVIIEGNYSKWKEVLSGVPQGSILGPLLFIIYVNDLPDVCHNLANIFLYADDAKLYKHIKNYEDHMKLQDSIKSLQDWMDEWKLNLNVEKCKVVSYGRKTDLNWKYYLVHDGVNKELEVLNEIKDLGLTFDSQLTFRNHINEKINKANSIMGIIKRNFIYFKPDTFILLYKSMVRSHLEYGQSVWSPFKKLDIENIERVQKRATKLVISIKKLAYIDRLKFLKLPTLKYRRVRGDMIEVYKILTNKYDPDIKMNLTLSDKDGTRGNTLKLVNIRSHYDLRKYNFNARVVNVWNSLPVEVVTAQSINSFKNRIDKHWKNQDLLYDFRSELTGLGNRSNLTIN